MSKWRSFRNFVNKLRIYLKKALFILLSAATILLCSCQTTGNISSGAVATLDHFKGEVTDMSPQRFPSRNVSYGYSIELRNDSAIVYLPYMGEVYSPVLGDEGLNFSHLYKNMKTSRNKKGTATISTFTVSHGIINYDFRLEAFNSGYFSLHVQPSNAQSCNYSGRWEE